MAFTKNRAISGFAFALTNRTTGEAVTTGVCVGYVTGDGGTQRLMVNAPIHEGNGQWSIDILESEMNYDMVALLFVHPLAVLVEFTISTVGGTCYGGSGGCAASCDESGAVLDIAASVASPKRVRTVEGTVEERPIQEVIDADRYLAAKCAGNQNAPWGVRMARTRPSSPLGGGRNPTPPAQY